jgi:hypothetical protein
MEICKTQRPPSVTLPGGQILECHLFPENA